MGYYRFFNLITVAVTTGNDRCKHRLAKIMILKKEK
jgi:hypothetical protein